ncbi:TlyA family RNA methyltransferase [Tissierella creatinophila]
MKKRADVLLFEKELVSSRERSKKVILEGLVYIGDKKVSKPSEMFSDDLNIDIKVNPLVYVSRAGLKLRKAIDEFDLNLNNLVAMDIGSSTGGFTECMLNEGIRKVYAIDVGKDQLVEELRNDTRVIVMEETNIRDLTRNDIEEDIDFISIDVSFISLKLVLPITNNFLTTGGEIVALVKPQFEVGKENIGKKGIVKDKKLHFKVLESIIDYCVSLGFEVKSLTFSPIVGSKGNIEFLIYLKKSDIDIKKCISKALISDVIDTAHKNLE